MALATRCPHCKTTFRVAADQLKLRGGIVRCGTCSQVFDGNASLVELDTLLKSRCAEPAPASATPVEGPGDNAANTIMAEELTDVETAAPPRPPKPAYILDYDLSEPDPIDYDLSEPDNCSDIGVDPVSEDAVSASEPVAEAASEPVFAPVFAPVSEQISEQISEPESKSLSEPVSAPRSEPAATSLVKLPPAPPLAAAALLAQTAPESTPAQLEPNPSAAAHWRERDAEPSLELELDPAVLDAHAPVPHVDEPEDWPSPHELDHAHLHDLEIGPLPLVRESAPSLEPAVEPEAAPVVAPVRPEIAAPPPSDEPEFVRLHRENQEKARRRRLTFGVGSAILTLLLLAQFITNFRNPLAAQYPALKPVLSASCKVLGCKVELPAQIENLTMETGELQSLAPTSFQLTTLLRNEGSLIQTWPHIELQLTDASDKPVVRRVFTPAQYLPAGVVAGKGFAGRSEQAVKIQFELKQVKASGFHIAVFYP